MDPTQEILLQDTLKKVFGFNNFRGLQHDIIKSIMNAQNTMVLMPTGAGKSLCYQLPALIKEGTAIVISPLIALMKNQVDQLTAYDIKARFLNSSLSKSEITKVKNQVKSGEVKLLYIAPESLTKEENIAFLTESNVSFVAIDEAHCISEWGHDFRPSYRKLKTIVSQLGDIPVIALTATATPKVQLDIKKNLGMENANFFKSSFNRTNLYYEVRPKIEAKKQLIKFIKEHKKQSGIVYCLSRKKVEEIADFLKTNDIKAAPYHAGMESKERIANQDAFLNENIEVIVATIAFGMGIDKPSVRFVVHYNTPKSLEGYYQETGRAGRDGIKSDCLMFYTYKDILKLDTFNKDKAVSERENAKLLLEEMTSYAESATCRRKQLLHYFGEDWDNSHCGMCDNCVHPKEEFDGKEYIVKVIEAIAQTKERFDINHIAKVILGKNSEEINSYEHDKLSIFGKGKDKGDIFWKSIIRQTMLNEFICKNLENPNIFNITQKGHLFKKEPTSILLKKDHDYKVQDLEEETEANYMKNNAYDEILFDILINIRKKIATKKGFPPYVIFQEPSLEEMALTYPTKLEDLKKIVGVGESKAKKFGKEFVEAIEKYVNENNIATESDVIVKSTGSKHKNKINIIKLIDKKKDFQEIAENIQISFDQLLDEIENICFSGTKLNINYYINQVLDEEQQEDIYDYFMTSKTDNLDIAIDELEDYSEEEIRLMRIKFMSDNAH